MFKKDPRAKGSSNIKSSERRKLLSQICEKYGIDQNRLSKQDLSDLLPNTTKQASFKNELGVSGVIYSDENETPTWFKTRDSPIYPSLFTLWKCGYILPTVKTHPHVIQILSNGADLMLPGTIPPFDSRCIRGAVVGVVDSKNPTVVKAVGWCNFNLTQFDSVLGRTGTAVEIIHHLDDELYKLNKLVDIPIPELVKVEPEGVEEKKLEDEHNGQDNGQDKMVDSEQQHRPENYIFEENKVSNDQESNSLDTESLDDIAEKVSTLSVEDLDNFFKRSLIQTIKNDSIELPITASTFMSQHIYKNLPVIDQSYCNIKKTSWKKTSKFLKAMDKLGYLLIKGKDEDLSIIKLMAKDNLQVVNFVTHKTMASANAPTPPPTTSKKANELQIKLLYKPTSKSRMIFNKTDKNYMHYYPASELRSILDQYIKAMNLIDKSNPKLIILDETLRSITNIKQESAARDVTFKSFLTNFSPYHQILKPGETKGEVHKGEPPKIQIITEMKIGRKVVTRISNFESFYIKPHLLADELKVKCSGSATINPCVQNPKIIEVQIQGPHGNTIINLLKEKGIPLSYISFEDKVKKKKKKPVTTVATT